MELFDILFHTYSSNFGMYFTLTAHLSLDESHFGAQSLCIAGEHRK
jgi:hypothetical protein